jgi:predicted NBD/HSP70 family sugar kinase
MRFLTNNDEKQFSHQLIVKESNIKQVFDLIFDNEGISRIEVSKRAGLSRATVSMLVDELAKAGLVNILGAGDSNSSGRKPIMLEINKDRAQIIVVSMRKFFFNYILYDLKGNEIDVFSRKIIYKKGCAGKIWKNILEGSPHLKPEKLLAVCVSVPAKINNAEKTINLSILDIQDGCDLLTELKGIRSELPLLVGNQSSAFAYAEYKYRYNGKIEDMIYFNIEEGVGAGILLNGRVFTGEIGHMTIDSNGPLCSCGKRGCVESMISKTVLLREFGMLVEEDKRGLLHTLCKGEAKSIHYGYICKALEGGDPRAVMLAEHLAGKIAFCISNVICMFNPEEIIIGGGNVEALGRIFLDMIIQKIEIPGSKGVCAGNDMHIGYTLTSRNAEAKGMYRYFLDNLMTIMTETENTIYVWN